MPVYLSDFLVMKTDHQTFTKIVERYSEPLYWHIRRIGASHEDARDILQDSLVKAYRKLWQLRDESLLGAWLYRIATNESLNFLRRGYPAESLSEELCAKLDSSSFVDVSMKAEIGLQKALMRLSPMQRTVFSLRYYNEMSYKDIALVTGSNEDSLKVIYHNAKEKVKSYLTTVI